MWNDAIITNAGRALLARWMTGGTLTITKAATGEGTVPALMLMAQTTLANKKQDMSIVKKENTEEGSVRLQLQITSEGIEKPYTINQIGVWAKYNEEAETLLAIYQDETGVSAPTHEEMPDYVFTFFATLEVSNTGDLEVNVDPEALITREVLEETVRTHDEDPEAHEPIRTAAEQSLKTHNEDPEAHPKIRQSITEAVKQHDENETAHPALRKKAGNKLSITMDPKTFIVTIELQNAEGEKLDSKDFDLPLESVVVSGSYAEATKEIVLTLQSGKTVKIPVADLVDGLASTKEVNDALAKKFDTPGSGLEKDGTTIGHKNKVAPGSSTASEGKTTFGGTVEIPVITYDENGHIIETTTKKVTLPDDEATDEKPGLLSPAGKKRLDTLGTPITDAEVTLGAAPTYNGSTLTQTVTSVTLGGKVLKEGTDYFVSNNTAINAGEHTLAITGAGTYFGTLAVTYSIKKATGTASVSPSSVKISGAVGNTAAATVTTNNASGTITVSSNSIASGSVNGKTVTVKALAAGQTTLTITVGESANYTRATCQLSVNSDVYNSDFNAESWARISAASAADIAKSLWSIGAMKQTHVEGLVGTLDLNEDFYLFITAFNHNSGREGKGIRLECFKAVDDETDIALCDDHLYDYDESGEKWFNMNHNGAINTGGWAACDLRYDILGSTNVKGKDPSGNPATSPVPGTLMAALEEDLRAVMKPMTIWTDNVGGGTNRPENVTRSVDYLPLLSEFEIFGSITYSNAAEENYQAQLEYYANGNPTDKCQHNDHSSSCCWWERSVFADGSARFCRVLNGDPYYGRADHSFALAPQLCV